MHVKQDQEWRDSIFQPFLRHLSIRDLLYIKANASHGFRKDTGKVFIILDDQRQLTHRFLHFSGFSTGTTSGRVMVNMVPTSILLFTWISPLIKLTNCLTMDSPSPNPPWTRVAPLSTW